MPVYLVAVAGLGRHREAALALEEGLRMDPFDWPLKQALEAATQGIVRDLVEGVFLASQKQSETPCQQPNRRPRQLLDV